MGRVSERATVAEALAARRDLEAELGGAPSAYRLIHGAPDGFEGLSVDRYGGAILVEQHRREADPKALIEALAELGGAERPVFFKRRCSRDESDRAGRQVRGSPASPELEVREGDLRFLVHLTRGEHTGLFLDSRPARALVRGRSSDRRVLNLFSYTGGFGLAAAVGGARGTTNVDVKRSALSAARRNYEIQGAPHDTRTFLRDDSVRFLKRAARGRGRFDMVVVDPPPRYRLPGGRRFDARRGYQRLVELCLAVLDPGGLLLAGLNARAVSDQGFVAALEGSGEALGRELRLVERLGPGPDFPEGAGLPTARFALCEVE